MRSGRKVKEEQIIRSDNRNNTSENLKRHMAPEFVQQ